MNFIEINQGKYLTISGKVVRLWAKLYISWKTLNSFHPGDLFNPISIQCISINNKKEKN